MNSKETHIRNHNEQSNTKYNKNLKTEFNPKYDRNTKGDRFNYKKSDAQFKTGGSNNYQGFKADKGNYYNKDNHLYNNSNGYEKIKKQNYNEKSNKNFTNLYNSNNNHGFKYQKFNHDKSDGYDLHFQSNKFRESNSYTNYDDIDNLDVSNNLKLYQRSKYEVQRYPPQNIVDSRDHYKNESYFFKRKAYNHTQNMNHFDNNLYDKHSAKFNDNYKNDEYQYSFMPHSKNKGLQYKDFELMNDNRVSRYKGNANYRASDYQDDDRDYLDVCWQNADEKIWEEKLQKKNFNGDYSSNMVGGHSSYHNQKYHTNNYKSELDYGTNYNQQRSKKRY